MKVQLTFEFSRSDREILKDYYGDEALMTHEQLRGWAIGVVRDNLHEFADSVDMAEKDEREPQERTEAESL